jgi:hypothetical protein
MVTADTHPPPRMDLVMESVRSLVCARNKYSCLVYPRLCIAYNLKISCYSHYGKQHRGASKKLKVELPYDPQFHS